MVGFFVFFFVFVVVWWCDVVFGGFVGWCDVVFGEFGGCGGVFYVFCVGVVFVFWF